MFFIYRVIQTLLLPLILVFFVIRIIKKKEDYTRVKERFGFAGFSRDFSKKLVWIHAASVGESNSVLPLIKSLSDNKKIQVMLTTGSVTSANLMQKKLPENVIHQYIPIDLWFCVKKFYKHWQPDLAMFVDSDLWPNLLDYSKNLILINARMSDRSFARYSKYNKIAKKLLDKLEIIFAQSDQDTKRFASLTNTAVVNSGNLKYDGPAPAFDKQDYAYFKEKLKDKKVLVVSSTHQGEDEYFAKLYIKLQAEINNLVMILVPRHPHRGAEILEITSQKLKLNSSLRSENKQIDDEVKVYIANTIGEVGLWYKLADLVLIGGSIIPHGGQNPLEALKAGKPVVTGKYMHNFKDMMDILLAKDIIVQASTKDKMYKHSLKVLQEQNYLQEFSKKAEEAIQELTGATEILLDYINKRVK